MRATIIGLRNGEPTAIEVDVPDAEVTTRQSRTAAARAARLPPLDGEKFLERLTPTEYRTIMLAAQASLEAGDPSLSIFIDTLRMTGAINLAGTKAQQAKAMVVAAGLLTQRRANEVFAG